MPIQGVEATVRKRISRKLPAGSLRKHNLNWPESLEGQYASPAELAVNRCPVLVHFVNGFGRTLFARSRRPNRTQLALR
jgi:hypothetical protein